MSIASPVCFDISDFHGLDWYAVSTRIASILAQKGFCFVQGPVDQEDKTKAREEAAALKAAGRLNRTPAEAVDVFYGEAASAWTYEVRSSAEADAAELAEDEQGLRSIDSCLDQIGYCIVAGSTSQLKRAVRGRSRGILHHCRLEEDEEAPPLVDPEQASVYASHCSSRKVVLLYYLGPSPAVASLAPRDAPSQVYEVRMKEDTVIAYMNDACTLLIEELGPALIFEVDLSLETKLSQQQAPKDLLGIPAVLHHWFEERLQKIRKDRNEDSEQVPFSYMKQAHLAYLPERPIKIVEFCCELPSIPRSTDSVITSLQGRLLGGCDTAIAIKPPPPAGTTRTGFSSLQYFGAKWDLQEYYDEEGDPDNFKTYCKHLNVLYRSYDTIQDFDYESFGLTREENASLDHRCRLMCEVHKLALQTVDGKAPQSEKGRPWGIFVGLSGQQQDWHYMTGEAKINKHTWANSSTAALVSRCSYGLNFSGPAIAVDTGDSSGLIACDSAVRALREGTCPTAFASSASWISNPFELALLCFGGFVSKSGRTRVFDESSDGYTKGEGVVTLLLRRPKEELKDLREAKDAKGLILGSGVNNKGQSSSLGSPSGPALRDVLYRASRDANSPAFLLDAVEASASGDKICDMIELMVVHKQIAHQDTSAQAVVMSSSKAGFGNLGAPSGLLGVARNVFLLERGVHAPQIHLHQLLLDLPAEDDGERWRFLTEVVEARGYAQLQGVSSFGRTGSNCHQVMIGERPEKIRTPLPSRSIRWWPGYKSQEKQAVPALRGYFLVGTMTAWTDGLRMEEESDGVYAYTLTMGDNNWEKFQIWLDEDPDKVLYPGNPNEGKEAAIVGPESSVDKALSWRISGMCHQARLINEEQYKTLAEGEDSMDCMVAFGGNYVPENVSDPADISQMPVANLNAGMEGNPGDKYRIRLHVQGQYRRLEWFKARGADAVAPLGRRRFAHKFAIIGDHSYWTFEDMQEEEKGVFAAEVRILKESSNFQIYRDRDFEQGFYPAPEATAGGSDQEIQGPDELGQGSNWVVKGKVGDVFKITFRRQVRRGQDKRSISWERLRNETVDFQEMSRSHKYYLVGSWNQFRECKEMLEHEVNEQKRVLKQEFTVGKTGTEKFQILLNCNFLATVHPDVDEASQTGYKLRGPDDAGSGKYWATGTSEQLFQGDHVMVYLELSGGLPHNVWWERFNSPDAHQEYLAAGAQRVWERHNRLMGLIPWQSDEKPARLVNPPEWYGGGREREDLVMKNVFVLTQEMLDPNYGKKEVEEEPFALSDK